MPIVNRKSQIVNLFHAVQGFGEAGEVALDGEVRGEMGAGQLAAFDGEHIQDGGGDFRWILPADQAGIIRRQHFGQRTPARRHNGQAERHRLNEVDRLVFTQIARGKKKQVGLVQQTGFALAGDEADVLDHGGDLRVFFATH